MQKGRFKLVLQVPPWLLLALAISWFVWFHGWEDMRSGRLHRRAHGLFSLNARAITEARIYLLMGETSAKTAEEFPCGSEGMSPVYGSLVLRGQELELFMEIWRRHEETLSLEQKGMCHEPAYGFRLYRSDEVAAETSMCWKCSNFTVNLWPQGTDTYGFDADSKPAKELLDFCDSRLPYKRPASSKSRRPAKVPLASALTRASDFVFDESYRGHRLRDLFEIESISRAPGSQPGSVWHVHLSERDDKQSVKVEEEISPGVRKRKTLVVDEHGNVSLEEL